MENWKDQLIEVDLIRVYVLFRECIEPALVLLMSKKEAKETLKYFYENPTGTCEGTTANGMDYVLSFDAIAALTIGNGK